MHLKLHEVYNTKVDNVALTQECYTRLNILPSWISLHFVQDGMINVFKYQMNSFLLPEYLNEVY